MCMLYTNTIGENVVEFTDLTFCHTPPPCPPPGVPRLHVTYGGKELEHLRRDLRVVDYKRFSVLPVTQGRQYKTFERVEFGVRSVIVSVHSFITFGIA